MFEKMRPAVCVLLIVMLFVFITEHGETHNYQNHKYLYVVASASAGINGYGEDRLATTRSIGYMRVLLYQRLPI